MAGVLDDDVLGAGDPPDDLLASATAGVSRSPSPLITSVSMPVSGAEVLALVEAVDVGEEGRHDVEGRREDHVADEVDEVGAHRGVEGPALARRGPATPRPTLRSSPIGPACRDSRVSTPRPERADDAADVRAQAELGHLGAAGARRDQGDGEDPVAHDVGVLPDEAIDRHAAHRVADEHDRPARAGRVEDGREVAAELGDGAVLEGGVAGAAVPALVVADDAEARVDEGPTLEDPASASTGRTRGRGRRSASGR